jgi:SAM-dependent methyltransferase
MRIHESSPAERGISLKLRSEAPRYIGTHFFQNQIMGEFIGQFRNENLEHQTFHNEIFDLVISLDVMEHVFNPELAYQEIYRTLCKGGLYIHTFPIKKSQLEAAIPRAELGADGRIVHLVETPEYHGNPIDNGSSLVTFDYGYDIGKKISEWAPFDVWINRYWDQKYGIIGEHTEVIVCHKR